jgi:hypothetical protein
MILGGVGGGWRGRGIGNKPQELLLAEGHGAWTSTGKAIQPGLALCSFWEEALNKLFFVVLF